MSKYSPNSKAEFVEEKRKLLYWVARWTEEETQFENINLDIPEVSVLLQAMGFRLENFEKVLELESVPIIPRIVNMEDKHMVQIELTCPTSGMKSSLIKQTAACKCPSTEDASKGEFWSISGCGPSSRNSIDVSNSSLLPKLTPQKTRILNVLLRKILMIINDTDIEENEEKPKPFTNASFLMRHRSLDTLKSNEDAILAPKPLKRGPSWEVDPKTSPPTQTSSPVQLCNSLSRISLNSGDHNNILKNLENIKKMVDETLEIASMGANATFVKNAVPKKRVSDIKPSEGPFVDDLIKLDNSRPKIVTPRKILTPKKKLGNSGEKRDNIVGPSRIATLRAKNSGVPSISPTLRKDTPRPRTSLIKQSLGNTGSCESILKSKLVGVKSKLSPKLLKRGEAGSSGIAKLKSLGSTTNINTKK